MKTPRGLRRLMRACVDDECALRHEVRFVDAGRAEVLARLSRERGEFIAELEQLGARVERRVSGSWAELLREAARDLWVTAAGRNNGDAIAACRHSHARTEAQYDVAIQRPLSDAAREVVTAQLRRLRDDARVLDRLQF